MPFDCQDKNEPWFLFLQGALKTREEAPLSASSFFFVMDITIGFIEAKIYSKYIFKGKRQLSESFLQKMKGWTMLASSLQMKRIVRSLLLLIIIESFLP